MQGNTIDRHMLQPVRSGDPALDVDGVVIDCLAFGHILQAEVHLPLSRAASGKKALLSGIKHAGSLKGDLDRLPKRLRAVTHRKRPAP